MILDRLKEQLKVDEGIRYKIYLDSEGLPTFGVGHLITKQDVEYGLPVGTRIDPERVEMFFEKDLQNAIAICKEIFPDFCIMQDELQEILVNMAFNLGNRLKRFKKMIKAISEKDYKKAAFEMENSKWFIQVGNRSKRLKERMLQL